MGTNYQAKINICPCCKKPEETIHLGKSSPGWSFALQYNGGRFYTDFEGMKIWLKDKVIEDEYGDRVSVEEFIKLVESKKKIKDPSADYGAREYQIIKIDGYKFFDYEFS